jgi:acetyl esterase/lipase
MDPDVAAIADAMPDIDITDVAAARAANDAIVAPLHAELSYEGVDIVEVTAPGRDGAPDVPIRLMRPAAASVGLPVLLAAHGGGFVLGESRDFDYFCLEAVRRLGIAVANVEYRLAPETPFPGPLDDCFAALEFLAAQGTELGLDPTRIAVGGSSAGGGLAAGTALRARDEGGPAITFQLLLSPAIDDGHRTTEARLADAPMMAKRTGDLVWRYYLGSGYTGPDDTDVSPYAVPARATDLSGLPPTYIAAMEFDPIRDSNIDYAVRLLRAGVRVELHSHPGTFHGSVELAPHAASSARVLAGLIDALGRGLGVDVASASGATAP